MSQAAKTNKNQPEEQPEKEKCYIIDNKYDPYLVKDAIVSFIGDYMVNAKQVKEEHTFRKFRLIFGLFITLITIYSHYHFIPWPADYYIILGSIIGYYILTYIYNKYAET